MGVIVPSDLFELANIGEPWPKHLAKARRLLVTLWVVTPAGKRPKQDDSERARWVWGVDEGGLNRPGRVTVLSVLLQLRQIGVIDGCDEVPGGYEVTLAKEEAA